MKIINFPKLVLNKKIMNCLLQNKCSIKQVEKPKVEVDQIYEKDDKNKTQLNDLF